MHDDETNDACTRRHRSNPNSTVKSVKFYYVPRLLWQNGKCVALLDGIPDDIMILFFYKALVGETPSFRIVVGEKVRVLPKGQI